MTKKELTEIKKLYSIKECTVSKIAGCYVDGESNIKSTFSESFLTLPEEEQYKYIEFFKKSLSGKKNITTTEFPTDCEETGTIHELLLRIRDTKLTNAEMLMTFYEKMIETYRAESSNYLILLISNIYDIPGKGDDGFKDQDMSEEVYDYISCYICPVGLEDGGLTYSEEQSKFIHKERRWCVEAPCYSFLFPSFEDRSADIHHLTVYTKKTDGSMNYMMEEMFGMNAELSSDEQKLVFQSAVEASIQNEDNALEVITAINTAIIERMEDKTEELELGVNEIKAIVQESGMSEESCKIVAKELEEKLGNTCLKAENIVDTKVTQVKSPDVVIKINNELADKVSIKVIDSEKYIVVPYISGYDVEINGISID